MFKGELSVSRETIKDARLVYGTISYKIIAELTCHGANKVFSGGYTRKLATDFKHDVMAEFGISKKQAGKYTEAVSAALGVRGLRRGVEAIAGLDVAAADGPASVEEFLLASDIRTFNAFINRTRADVDALDALAQRIAKLNDEEQTDLFARVTVSTKKARAAQVNIDAKAAAKAAKKAA